MKEITSCIVTFAFAYIPRSPAFDLTVNWTVYVTPFLFWTWFDGITAETVYKIMKYFIVS